VNRTETLCLIGAGVPWGMQTELGCRSFSATGIAAYLEASGTLENAQAMRRMRPSARLQ